MHSLMSYDLQEMCHTIYKLDPRGVHIEVFEEMSDSSFINAYRRVVALQGPVKQIRSDRGKNFVGSTNDLNINTINVEDGLVKSVLDENGTTWILNPLTPHTWVGFGSG